MTTTADRIAATAARRAKPPAANFRAPVVPEALRAPTIPDSRVRAARRRAAKAAAQAQPETSEERTHNGVAIVREEPVKSPLPTGAPFRYSRLFLEDGEVVWGCRDCPEITNTRGEVMAHRNARHGTRYGKKRAKVTVEPQADLDLFDMVLPPRADGEPVPESPMDWTIGEVVAIMPTVKALGDLIDRLEKEVEELRGQLKQTRVSRTDMHKIEVYASNQQEIGELRAWKKAVVKKFASLNFKLEESIEEE